MDQIVSLKKQSIRRSFSFCFYVFACQLNPVNLNKTDLQNVWKQSTIFCIIYCKTFIFLQRSTNSQGITRSSIKQEIPVVNGGTQLLANSQPKSNNTSQDEGWKIKQTSRKLPFSGPLHGSNSFAWTKKTKGQTNLKSLTKSISRQDKSGTLDPSNISKTSIFKLTNAASGDLGFAPNSNLKDHESYESMKDAMLKQWMHPEHQDPVYTFGTFHTRNLSETTLHRQDTMLSQNILVFVDLLLTVFIFYNANLYCIYSLTTYRVVKIKDEKLSCPDLYFRHKRLTNS